MKMLTLRLKPKTIFGLILIAAGIIVICITFYSNHVNSVSNTVMLETDSAREQYLTSLGWEFKTPCEEKEVQIPQQFNDTYLKYNEIQKQQGFDLEKYKGQSATVYTYNITNYKGYENRDCVYADLLVCSGELIGCDVYSTSVSNGFMQPLSGN